MPNPPTQHHARLFRNGRNQALRIPREFELPGDEVIIHKDGHRLIVEPAAMRRASSRRGRFTTADNTFVSSK